MKTNKYKQFTKYKQLKVPPDLHKKLKTAAAQRKTTVINLLWEFIKSLKQ